MSDENTEVEVLQQDTQIGRFRQWFREAVDAAADGRDEAREGYEFVAGK